MDVELLRERGVGGAGIRVVECRVEGRMPGGNWEENSDLVSEMS